MVQQYKPLYTVIEAAKILMVNKSFVNTEINKGNIPALNMGRRKIRGSDLEKYIENFPVAERGGMD